MSYSDFHAKHRPTTFKQIVGHEQAVSRLKGMLASGKIPGAILISGPSSVGKTTLARVLAQEINNLPVKDQTTDYIEHDCGEKRSIDDIRELIKIASYRPRANRKIIVLDEAQQILTNAPAAGALLKVLEEASKTKVTWVLCTMEPGKFGSSTGKAISNRCIQFVLEPPTNKELYTQGKRIVKREGLSFIDEDTLKSVVKSSNGTMRTLASLLQSLRDYWEGQDPKPKKLKSSVLSEVIKSSEGNDDALVVKVIVATLLGQFAEAQRAILNIADTYQFINKLVYASTFLVNHSVLKGARHPKVWYTGTNKELLAELKSTNLNLGSFAALQYQMVELKARSGLFAVSESELITSCVYKTIKELYPPK